jgi:cell filamentation protein
MSKDGFPFAAPQFIANSMRDFEVKFLKKYTPCKFTKDEDLAHALGVVHVEFIIIHPFREGNGRVARLLANLMALQAERSILNYEPIDRTINPTGYSDYIKAIHKGVDLDYERIQNIFLDLLKAT